MCEAENEWFLGEFFFFECKYSWIGGLFSTVNNNYAFHPDDIHPNHHSTKQQMLIMSIPYHQMNRVLLVIQSFEQFFFVSNTNF